MDRKEDRMIQVFIAKFATQLIVGAVLAAIAGAGFLRVKIHYGPRT